MIDVAIIREHEELALEYARRARRSPHGFLGKSEAFWLGAAGVYDLWAQDRADGFDQLTVEEEA